VELVTARLRSADILVCGTLAIGLSILRITATEFWAGNTPEAVFFVLFLVRFLEFPS